MRAVLFVPAVVVATLVIGVAAPSCRVVKVDCRVDDDCDGDEVCEDNECIECQRDRDCAANEECDDGVCEPAEGEGEGEGEGGEGEGGEGEGEGGDAPRRACTSSFGDIITVGSGRLDGTLVAIVMPNANGCRGDDNHVHLQVEADGEIYDVAINTSSEFNDEDPRVAMASTTIEEMPGDPYEPGWHAGAIAQYPFHFGVPSDQFVPMENGPLADAIVDALRTAGPISVFMVGFDDGSGGHKVHKNSNGTDGLIVIHPESASPTAIAFRFQDQFF